MYPGKSRRSKWLLVDPVHVHRKVIRPRYDGRGEGEPELAPGNVHGVLFAVLHDDVQDPVRRFGRFAVLTGVATAGGFQGDEPVVDVGAYV